MRGDLKALRLLVSSVLIGVSAVAIVGTISESLKKNAHLRALQTVGGDLSFRLFHRPPSKIELSSISKNGTVSITTELRPMARAYNKNKEPRSMMVELKGIDDQYPLYGKLKTDPKHKLLKLLDQIEGLHGAVGDPALFETLGLKVGDSIMIGEKRYQLRGKLLFEPERAFRFFKLGPRLIVLGSTLSSTGLISEGAEVYYYTLLKLPNGTSTFNSAKRIRTTINQNLPNSGWRVVNAHEGVPGLERTIEIIYILLLFLCLSMMLLGGAGITGAVRAHLQEKQLVIAILKMVGASKAIVRFAIGLQITTMSFLGSVIGVGVGALGPLLIKIAFFDEIPFTMEIAPDLRPLLIATLFGILVTWLFAWSPLVVATKIPPKKLLRGRITNYKKNICSLSLKGVAIISLSLFTLMLWVSSIPILTTGFIIFALILTIFYILLGNGIKHFTKVFSKNKTAKIRLILGNFYRSGAPTRPIVFTLGLTLTLLIALDGISQSIKEHLSEFLPSSSPDIVIFSIDPNLLRPLEKVLENSKVVREYKFMPFLHARIQAINNKPIDTLDLPRSIDWVIRGDRGISVFREKISENVHDSSYEDRPGYSLDRNVAKKLNLKLNDELTLNLSGKIRTGFILDFHIVDWTKLDLDFPIIANPIALRGVPFTFAGALKAKEGGIKKLEELVKGEFPSISLIRVTEVLIIFEKVLNKVMFGLKLFAALCGLISLIVLASSVIQGLRERIREAVLLKILGASRLRLLSLISLEFLSISVFVSLFAIPLGALIVFAVAKVANLNAMSISLSNAVILCLISTFLTIIVGLISTINVYKSSPLRILNDWRV